MTESEQISANFEEKSHAKQMIRLRAHHLLCIPHFTGHGYDPAFTAHMTALTARLSADPHTRITLTEGCDTLCAACPHQTEGGCDAAEKVAAMDSAVLQLCGLKAGDSAEWAALFDLACRRILQTEHFHKICACCQWYALCRHTEVFYDLHT